MNEYTGGFDNVYKPCTGLTLSFSCETRTGKYCSNTKRFIYIVLFVEYTVIENQTQSFSINNF